MELPSSVIRLDFDKALQFKIQFFIFFFAHKQEQIFSAWKINGCLFKPR